MLTRMNAEPRSRAISFMTGVEDRCARSVAACPGGHVVLDPRHPALWSANHIRIEDRTHVDAESLDATAAEHLDSLGFRMIAVLDETAGLSLAAPLAARGYRDIAELLMVLEGEPSSHDPAAPVVEVSGDELRASRIAAQVECGRDEEVGRQLASRDELIAAAIPVRRLAIRAGRQIASRVQVYTSEGIAQIDNMYTARAHRRQGYSRALMERAVHVARLDGAQLVFLVADAGDWPQRFYRRLGFADTGLLPRFLRIPPRS